MNPVTMFWVRQAGVVLIVLLSVTACNKTPARYTTVDNVPRNSKISTLLEENSTIVAGLPEHPQSNQLLDQVLSVARSEGIEHPEDLLYHFRDTDFGIYLFDMVYHNHKLFSEKESSLLCSDILQQSPGSAIAMRALFCQLQESRINNVSFFLTRCAELADNKSKTRERAISLIARADYYRDTGKTQKAAADYLDLWASCPDRVKQMNARLRFISCLQQAGLYLEADTLENAYLPELIATRLFEELGDILKTNAPRQPLSPSELYVSCTPDPGCMIDKGEEPRVGNFSAVYFWARVTRLYVVRLDIPHTLQAASYFLASFDLLLKTELSKEDVLFLSAIAGAVDDRLQQLTSDASLARVPTQESPTNGLVTSLESRDIVIAVSNLRVRIQEKLFSAEWDKDNQRLIVTFARHGDLLDSLNMRKELIDFYERVTAEYTDQEIAIPFLVKLADFYRRKVASPQKAADILSRVTIGFPESPQAETSLMEQALCLYEAGDDSASLEILQEFSGRFPNSVNMPKVEFLAALSEARMGFTNEAESHMKRVANSYSQSDVAAKALFWLGSNSLSKQDYANALLTLKYLISTYPATPYAEKARTLVKKLEYAPPLKEK